jgi:glycosyltransferase involved in cell wall biosynthesis
MKIAFISNFLSAHQQPVCDALAHMLDVEFRFIALTPISQTRKQMGWKDLNDTDYVIKAYINEEEKKALDFVSGADVAIFGHDKVDIYFKSAIRNRHSIVFRCSERLYKQGRWRALSPRGIWNRWNTYYCYPKENQYLLCASAYAAKDFALLGSYLGKSFKWGYFPPVDFYDIELRISQKKHGSIFWAGRMLSWKHPETAIYIAKQLREKQIPFELNMAGDGPMFDEIQGMVKREQLEKSVHLLGNCSPEIVRKYMADSQIYLATSDYQEGWGAVVNEAMAEGCAVVACEAMGAGPYLIQSGKNGYLFHFGRNDIACEQVAKLLLNKKLCDSFIKAAYQTIQEDWSADCAAQRLVQLSKALLNGNGCVFFSGPCSKAELL